MWQSTGGPDIADWIGERTIVGSRLISQDLAFVVESQDEHGTVVLEPWLDRLQWERYCAGRPYLRCILRLRLC